MSNLSNREKIVTITIKLSKKLMLDQFQIELSLDPKIETIIN